MKSLNKLVKLVLSRLSDFVFEKGTTAEYAIWVKEFGPVARELR